MPRRDQGPAVRRADPRSAGSAGGCASGWWCRRRNCCVPSAWAQARAGVASARMWPAQEYTRIIVESNAPLAHQVLVLRNPDRLVLDIDGVEVSSELAQLPARVQAADPLHRRRSGSAASRRTSFARRVRPEVRSAGPIVFALKPVAEFGHRLVLDLYPMVPLDPLMALLESERARTSAGRAAGGQRVRACAGAAAGRTERTAADHDRDRSGPWRRRSRRDRAPRHVREARRARDREAS